MIEYNDFNLIQNSLHANISKLENRTIFITGGTGFFGKWLLEAINYLNEQHKLNINIIILSREPRVFQYSHPHLCCKSSISFIKGDIRTFKFPGDNVDYIIHAATDASATLNKENQQLMRSTIIDGAKHIVKFANSTNCKKLLFTSSGAAYGPQPLDMKNISEDFEFNRNFDNSDAYALSKLQTEKYLDENLNCELLIARCFAFSGPYLPLDGRFAFGNFINNRLKHQNIEISSTGHSTRSYLYGADLAIWLLTILLKGKDREVYNVGSDESVSIFELANKIAGNEVVVNVGKKDVTSYYVPNIDKCKVELGLRVYTSLDDSIKKTLSFQSVK